MCSKISNVGNQGMIPVLKEYSLTENEIPTGDFIITWLK